MEITSVTSKGQVTIPKELRQQLGIRHAQEPAHVGADRFRPRDPGQAMIGLDTNVLARYYIDDDSDAQARRQREAARRLVESGRPLMVSKSVILELESVMRGYYEFAPAEVASVMRHLLGQGHITIEDRGAVEQAMANCETGIDFADALHHASYRSCDSVATFDDRKFARRAKKLGLAPPVTVLPHPSA